jgi:hypothetical protein
MFWIVAVLAIGIAAIVIELKHVLLPMEPSSPREIKNLLRFPQNNPKNSPDVLIIYT